MHFKRSRDRKGAVLEPVATTNRCIPTSSLPGSARSGPRDVHDRIPGIFTTATVEFHRDASHANSPAFRPGMPNFETLREVWGGKDEFVSFPCASSAPFAL
jgi:hypothetical protein